MDLMSWVPHPGQPVPVIEDLLAAFQAGGTPIQAVIAVALTGIAGFAMLTLGMLARNLARLAE